MAGFFAILWLLSSLFLFIGMISPKTVSKWVRKDLSRKKIFGIFGSLCVGSFIVFAATVPSTPPSTRAVSVDQPVQREVATTTVTSTTPSETIDSNEAQTVIENFFTSLNSASFQEAYQILAPQMQENNSFSAWKEGYKNTLHQEVKSVNCIDKNCDVMVLATEVTSSTLKKVNYDFIYTLEKENNVLIITSGRLVSQNVLEESPKEPVEEVAVSGDQAPVATVQPSSIVEEAPQITSEPQKTSDPGLSNNNYYTNSVGNTVHSPSYTSDNSVPAGATARCRDGTYSFSQSRRGTCSHHGGVAEWL